MEAAATAGASSSAEVDLLASLPAEYFTPPGSFDAVQHMLECLPDDVDEAFIGRQAAQTARVLEAVSAKLSARVMRSYGAFVHGMAQVQQLKSDLTLTAIQVDPGLAILSNLRRKRALSELLALAQGVCCLRADSLQVLAMLRAAAQPGVAGGGGGRLDLLRCAELQQACERRAAQLSRLKPVKRMEGRIANAAEALQDAMHAELLKSSAAFDEETYAAAIGCALALDRVDDLVNRMHMNFAEAIKVSTKGVLHTHVLLSLGSVTDAQEASIERGKYKDVCAMLSEEFFDSCLAQNFKALLQVLHSHDRMLRFLCRSSASADAAAARAAIDAATADATPLDAPAHTAGASGAPAAAPAAAATAAVPPTPAAAAGGAAAPAPAAADRGAVADAASVHRQAEWRASRLRLLRSVLAKSRPTLWDLMQRRVAVFLGAAPLGAGLDDFIDVSHGTLAFMRLGEAFAAAESHGLRAAVAAKGRQFYRRFHRERLEELRMRLETETWDALPMGSGWRLGQIRELGGDDARRAAPPLRCRAIFSLLPRPAGSPAHSGANGRAADEPEPFGGRYAVAAAFFDAMDEGRVPTPQRGASAGADPEPPPPPAGPESGPALCATALNAARFIGRYLRLVREAGRENKTDTAPEAGPAAPLALEAVRGAAGVAQLYVWTVFSVFWTGPPPGAAGFAEHDPGMPPPLRRMLLSLHAATHLPASDQPEPLIDDAADRHADLAAAAAAIPLERLRAPLESMDMFALPQTIVAMESLRLFADVLQEHLIPAALALGSRGQPIAARMQELVAQVDPLGAQIYRGVARGMLDLAPVVAAIRTRSWAQKEIGTQHSGYVEQLVCHVQQLVSSLSTLRVPPHAYRSLMGEAVNAVCEHIVDGYATVRKVTDEGRAQMSLDAKTLHAALRKLLPDMAPSISYVEDYIRAFYLPPQDLLAWARAHPRYSVRHRTALATLNGVCAGLKKKEQQELLEVLTRPVA